MRTAILLGMLIGAVFAVGYLDKPPTESEQVYNACMKARAEYSQFSENYCGALQDDYHVKFLCNQTNTKCFVEKK